MLLISKQPLTTTSLPIGSNGKTTSSAIDKLMIGKTLDTNGEKITNAMIGNNVFVIYW